MVSKFGSAVYRAFTIRHYVLNQWSKLAAVSSNAESSNPVNNATLVNHHAAANTNFVKQKRRKTDNAKYSPHQDGGAGSSGSGNYRRRKPSKTPRPPDAESAKYYKSSPSQPLDIIFHDKCRAARIQSSNTIFSSNLRYFSTSTTFVGGLLASPVNVNDKNATAEQQPKTPPNANSDNDNFGEKKCQIESWNKFLNSKDNEPFHLKQQDRTVRQFDTPQGTENYQKLYHEQNPKTNQNHKLVQNLNNKHQDSSQHLNKKEPGGWTDYDNTNPKNINNDKQQTTESSKSQNNETKKFENQNHSKSLHQISDTTTTTETTKIKTTNDRNGLSRNLNCIDNRLTNCSKIIANPYSIIYKKLLVSIPRTNSKSRLLPAATLISKRILESKRIAPSDLFFTSGKVGLTSCRKNNSNSITASSSYQQQQATKYNRHFNNTIKQQNHIAIRKRIGGKVKRFRGKITSLVSSMTSWLGQRRLVGAFKSCADITKVGRVLAKSGDDPKMMRIISRCNTNKLRSSSNFIDIRKFSRGSSIDSCSCVSGRVAILKKGVLFDRMKVTFTKLSRSSINVVKKTMIQNTPPIRRIGSPKYF